MLSILKTIGMGVLYTILSPFILLVLALYFIYTFLVFIGMFFVNIFKFFKGKSVTDDLPIEVKAKQILAAQEQYEARLRDAILTNNVNPAQPNPYPTPMPNPAPAQMNNPNSMVNSNPYSNPVPNPNPLNEEYNNQAPDTNNEGGEFND